MAKSKKGLGRGLDALFSTVDSDLDASDIVSGLDREPAESVVEIKLIDVEPNKGQPRKVFDKEKLSALTESIKIHGVVQPILVRPTDNNTYMIIAGERRWRAARDAGLKKIPCIIKNLEDLEVMEIAMIENLQREDLNPIEEAEGYRRLMDVFGLTQEQLSEKLGKSRSAIANSLRLTNLPEDIKGLVSLGKLSQGHARALIPVEDEELRSLLAKKIVDEELNVRQTEALIAKVGKPEKKKPKTSGMMQKYFNDIESELSNTFGTKVKIRDGSNKGKIEIEYYSKDDLERILFEIRNYLQKNA